MMWYGIRLTVSASGIKRVLTDCWPFHHEDASLATMLQSMMIRFGVVL